MGWDDLQRKANGDTTPPADLKKGHRREASSATAGLVSARLPPHSLEAEQGVLGCILLAPEDVMSEAQDKLPAGAEVFYSLPNQDVFKTLAGMFQAREGIDLLTLVQKLKEGGKLEGIGGVAYLSSLPEKAPSAAHFSYYADIVLEKYFARKAIETCGRIISRVYENDGQSEQALDAMERDVMLLSMERTKGKKKIRPMREHIQANMRTIEQQQAGIVTGLKTGFKDLDAKTGGLQCKNFYIIAARPSVGKTSIAMNIAEYAALELGHPVGVFSLEMSAEALSMRFLSSHARVCMRNVKDNFSSQDQCLVMKSASKLSQAPIWIDDDSGLNILQIRSRARRMVQEYGVGLFIIDYLQLIQPFDKRMLREESMDQTAFGCKEMAKELDKPVLVAAQLNRDVEKRGKNAHPTMADLRGSGAIEQHADFIGLLFSPAEEKDRFNETIPVTLNIAKQRNGPTGDVDLIFRRSITRFESKSAIADEDVPKQTQMPYPEDERPSDYEPV